MTSSYDPYSDFSYVALNKRRRGESERRNSEKLENRVGKPAVKKIYIKANGDPRSKKPKLFVWRKWQSPMLAGLRADMAPYVGLDVATAIYDINGRRITSEEDIKDYGTYYVVGDEELLIPDSDDDYDEEEYREPWTRGGGRGTMSSPDMITSRQSLYDNAPTPPTPPPKPFQSQSVSLERFQSKAPTSQNRASNWKKARRHSESALSDWDEYKKYYNDAIMSISEEARRKSRNKQYKTPRRYPESRNGDEYSKRNSRSTHSRRYYNDDDDERLMPRVVDGYQSSDDRYRTQSRNQTVLASRSRSANDDYRNEEFVSDFDTDATKKRDKEALARHRQKFSNKSRSSSAVIYNRRDQTHPDAYIIYVFLNGQGMECQHIHFQKKQLAKGMNYILELAARRYNVNPMKLCDMDGRRITEPSQLMSRGAYVLVAAGQSFRDTWYFLPDNAIDTSSNRQRVEDRVDQRDRLLQRRERREQAKLKAQKSVPKKERTDASRRNETVIPGRRFGNIY